MSVFDSFEGKVGAQRKVAAGFCLVLILFFLYSSKTD